MLIISAPFGNYIQREGVISTFGTFTRYRRPGRIRQVLRTVRHANGGWINQLGLRNVGIEKAPAANPGKATDIVSLHIDADWVETMRYSLYKYDERQWIELNVSCPNVIVPEWSSSQVNKICKAFMSHYQWVSVKLPPVDYLNLFCFAFEAGITHFHCCNSYPTPIGGVSGKPLMPYSLACIKQLKKLAPEITVIGGGGIESTDDIKRYFEAGATHVAIGSALFNPLTHLRMGKLIKVANEPI